MNLPENYERIKIIRQSRLCESNETLIVFSQTQEIFNDGEDNELIYVVELEGKNDFNVHLCEGYNREAMEIVYCILRDNITDYIDLTKFGKTGSKFFLPVNIERITKGDRQ